MMGDWCGDRELRWVGGGDSASPVQPGSIANDDGDIAHFLEYKAFNQIDRGGTREPTTVQNRLSQEEPAVNSSGDKVNS